MTEETFEGPPIYHAEVCPHSKRCGSINLFERPCPKGKDKYICDHWGVGSDHDTLLKYTIKNIKRFNRAIKKIPDEWTLEGIKHWKISPPFRAPYMYPNDWEVIDKKGWMEEAHKLIDAGFIIGFNEDYGVGSIERYRGQFRAVLWTYQIKIIPAKGSLDDVLEWLWGWMYHYEED